MQQKLIDKTLKFIQQKRFATYNDEFFKNVSEFLANLLQINTVIIGKYDNKKPKFIETVAHFSNAHFIQNEKLNIENSPFESCIFNNHCVYSEHILQTYPDSSLLTQINAESFVGISLWGSSGEPIGILSLIDTKIIEDVVTTDYILQIIAIKISKVLEESIHDSIVTINEKNLKTVKHKVEESEIKFKKLSNLTFEGILIHDNGVAIDVNLSFLKMFGYSQEEILGKDVTQFIYPKKFHPNIYENRSNKYTFPYEIEGIRKDGTIFPLEVEARNIVSDQNKPLRVTAYRDISERRKAEKENKKLSIAVEQSANSIIITDSAGIIEYINPKFTELSGYHSDDILGKNFKIFSTHKSSQKKYLQLLSAISKGEIWKGQLQNTTKKGTFFWAQVTVTPVKNNAEEIINYLTIVEDITENKKAEKQLKNAYNTIKKNEDYLKNILKTAKEGFLILNKNSEIVQVNDEMCKIFGCDENELIKKSIFEFLDEENIKIYKNRLSNKTFKNKKGYVIEFKNNDGKIIPCLLKTSPILTKEGKNVGAFAFVTNISSIKNAHKKLENKNNELKRLSVELVEKNNQVLESKNRFLNLFEQSPVSLWEEDFSLVKQLLNKKKSETNDLRGYLNNNPEFVKECISSLKILNVNDISLKLLGFKTKEELISNFGKNFNKKSFETFKDEFVAIADGETEFTCETEFIKGNGEVISVILKLGLIEDKEIAIISIINITAIKNAEKELIKAKEAAEESNRLKTEFLNNMSHEIRTPLNGILGFSQFLSDPEITFEKQKHFVNIIQNSGHQLLHIIDDILEISKLGTKQVKVSESKVCLNDVLNELFSNFSMKAKENSTPLYLNKPLPDQECTIVTDKEKLFKIINNLLENAIKFTHKGSIDFGYYKKDKFIEIYVKDTGVGIAPEKHKTIFDRFSQAEKELTKNVGGLGLGLSIAKENTELLGGKISVKSDLHKGATFIVSLPFKTNETAKKNDLSETKVANKHIILIAEDEEVNFLYLETLLKDILKINCELIHAKNGNEALEMSKNNLKINLILMDIKMPVMNGYEATKRIKECYPNLPIIAQTAYTTSEEKEMAFSVGCDDFISKPINKEILHNALSKYLINTFDKAIIN